MTLRIPPRLVALLATLWCLPTVLRWSISAHDAATGAVVWTLSRMEALRLCYAAALDYDVTITLRLPW